MPAYSITDPASGKVRAVEVKTPRRARSHVAADLVVKRLTFREVFDLAKDGIILETPAEG